jgi:penicillin-binding protein 1A
VRALPSVLRLFLAIVVTGVLVATSCMVITPYATDLVHANKAVPEEIDLALLDDYAERSYIYAGDGQLLATLHGEENRQPVKLAAVPQPVIDAVLAVEDADFYNHGGVNVRANFRALLENVSAGGVEQGGSTITQQLVKNALLDDEQTFARKSKEAAIAIRLEQQLTEFAADFGAADPVRAAKDNILEKYLNTVYFGAGAYGVQAAAETYWGKDIGELSWAEGAMLAATISNPAAYDPTLHPEAATKQRQIALDRLVHLEKITADQARSFGTEALPVDRCSVADATATACGNLALPEQQGYFAEEVKQQLLNDPKYNVGADYETRYNSVFGGGLKVYTTLNPGLQTESERAIRDIVPPNDKNVQGVSVSIEPTTGAVRAMVGGPGFDHYQYNIATHQPGRQTGSSFKTFVLLTAFEQGNVPADYIGGAGTFPNPGGNDTTFEVKSGNGGSLTSVTTSSSNGAFVRLGYVVGLENVVELARKMGVTSDLPLFPSMPLGTLLTTPIEMASAYSAIPNGGIHEPYYLIDRVENSSGQVLYEHVPAGTRAFSQESACLATQVLEENVRSGTGRRAGLGRQAAAGKTGTTDNGADTWFVGFTPYLVTAVWMGNPDNQEENTEYIGGAENFGGVYPARIWGQLNTWYHDQLPDTSFNRCAGTRGGRTVKGLGDNRLAGGGQGADNGDN